MTEYQYYEQTNECANRRCAKPLGKWVLAPTFCDKCESELRESEEENRREGDCMTKPNEEQLAEINVRIAELMGWTPCPLFSNPSWTRRGMDARRCARPNAV